jgi:hypothetical protein
MSVSRLATVTPREIVARTERLFAMASSADGYAWIFNHPHLVFVVGVAHIPLAVLPRTVSANSTRIIGHLVNPHNPRQ